MSVSIELSQEGITVVTAEEEERVDLLLGGRRIWSVRLGPGDPGSEGPRLVPWPVSLSRRLRGLADLEARGADGVLLARRQVGFGDSTEPAVLVDPEGNPLAVDSGGRLVRTFEDKQPDQIAPLLDALDRVVGALRSQGLDAFPAYGTLLGTIRDGALIGHDNDVDIAYVSRHSLPVDVISESFAVQRALAHDGFETIRYSGAAFKVVVRTSAGVIGLDVFGGFFHRGHLALMGEIYTPFDEGWIRPLGTARLEGRTVPVPARPEKLLEAMYGPGWRVPDPTFVWSTPDDVVRRLDGWFRGTRFHRNLWDRRYSTFANRGPLRRRPHGLARLAHRELGTAGTVVDVGCGRGRDVMWLANRGHRAFGLDYAGNGFAKLSRVAAERGVPAAYWQVNLLEVRQTLAAGARLAIEPGPRAVLARHFVDATNARGRESLMRLSSMVLGRGGRLYLQFVSGNPPGTRDDPAVDDLLLRDVDPDEIAALAARFHGVVVERTSMVLAEDERPSLDTKDGPPVHGCRMVVEWAA